MKATVTELLGRVAEEIANSSSLDGNPHDDQPVGVIMPAALAKAIAAHFTEAAEPNDLDAAIAWLENDKGGGHGQLISELHRIKSATAGHQ